MGIVSDIARTWRRGPGGPVREHLDEGPVEARSLVTLMLGCGLVFIGQWPRLAREAEVTGAEFERLVVYELVAWLIVWPLAFYLIAGLVHLGSRALGGRGTPGGARVAVFWSWLAASPLALLAGATAGIIGPGLQSNLVGTAWLAAFVVFAAISQRIAGGGPSTHAT